MASLLLRQSGTDLMPDGTFMTSTTREEATWLVAKKIDAFTTAATEGNAAGVVECPDPLSDHQMLKMAREMNLSETVFVSPDPVGEAGHRLRFWTPTKEVPMCGHATVAALHHLHETHPERPSFSEFRLSTRVGPLVGRVRDGVAWTTMDSSSVLGAWGGAWGDLLQALGIAKEDIAEGATPVAMGPDWPVALEVRDVATLDRIRPDFALVERLSEQGVDGLIVFAMEGTKQEHDWHQRCFAPSWGIAEDPVTGTASARMASLLLSQGRLARPERGGTVKAKARQGDAMGRPGSVSVEIDIGPGGETLETRIGGPAVTSLEGRMRVPR
ncbi:MAG: PhzF family phenazine biosynthesis protein [Euryarchaeota archaeon]|nr:PhzF family phenazine biosynthesis protein [Euryarchaeota archaeon]